MMQRNVWMILALCLSLSACLTTGRKGGETAMAAYDLAPVGERGEWPAKVPPLALEVRAPDWFDSRGIEYRLAYADPSRLRDYSLARWVGAPASLIQQRLIQQQGWIPLGQGSARCLVRLEVDEFSQIFDSPEGSRGVLKARALLLDRTRSVLAQREFSLEYPAPSQDSRGGVTALSQTVGDLGKALADWQLGLVPNGKLKACQP